MDEMTMRISELEAEAEETGKLIGKLTAIQERDHAMLQKAVSAIEALHEAHQKLLADQEELRSQLHNIQRSTRLLIFWRIGSRRWMRQRRSSPAIWTISMRI